jgi:hypothetical protein
MVDNRDASIEPFGMQDIFFRAGERRVAIAGVLVTNNWND